MVGPEGLDIPICFTNRRFSDKINAKHALILSDDPRGSDAFQASYHKKTTLKKGGFFYGGSGGTRTPDQTVMSGQL